jgi:hypothetical protein
VRPRNRLRNRKRTAEQNHWRERGRATSVANADALGRARSARTESGWKSAAPLGTKYLKGDIMKRKVLLLCIGLMLVSATAWGSEPLKAMPAATMKESQDFFAAKKTADADAYQKFIQSHPGSALMSVFEDEMEFGGTIVSPGDNRWERWLFLNPKHGNGEKLLLTTDEAAKWGLITVIDGKIFGEAIPGKITVYAEPSSLVTSRKEKCWRILAIKK